MQMFKVRIQMQKNKKNLWRRLNAHSNAQHSNVHSNAFVFVNKPA